MSATTAARTRPPTHRDARRAAADVRRGQGLIELLRRPAAFFAATWAALLGAVTVVGIVPALAGSTRATSHPDADDDVTFTSVLRHIRGTLARDWPVSLGLVAFVALAIGDVVILRHADAGTRVFLGGALIPVTWVVVSWLSAYVVSAVEPDRSRGEVARLATLRLLRQPGRAMLAPALVLVLSPLWLLAPLTIAVGLSLPPWVLARSWGRAPSA